MRKEYNNNNSSNTIVSKDINDHKSKAFDEIPFEEIYNEYTLNIFSDASISGTYGCYGSVAVCRDTEYERSIFTRENTTVNECELLGLRLSLLIASKYQNRFRVINIFSDSLISVFTICNYRQHVYIPYTDNNGQICYQVGRYNNQHKLEPYKNQQILVDCIWLYNELLKNPNISINILHQSGHIIPNKFSRLNEIKDIEIEEAKRKFIDNNPRYSYSTPSTEFIIYISRYNDAMDRTTRLALQEMQQRFYQQYYTTPIHFRPLCCVYKNLLER